MVLVLDIHTKFLDSIKKSRTLFTYCRTPVGPHSNAGIESAFLDAIKAWEVFLDELMFAYLRGEQDIKGNSVPTTIFLASDSLDVYIKAMTGGRNRYVDWTNPDQDVIPRLKVFFDPPLNVKLAGGVTELREMLQCRNAIAHTSSVANDRLRELWLQKTGTSKSQIRSADILLEQVPNNNSPLTWFERYLQILESLSQELVEM